MYMNSHYLLRRNIYIYVCVCVCVCFNCTHAYALDSKLVLFNGNLFHNINRHDLNSFVAKLTLSNFLNRDFKGLNPTYPLL